MSNLNILEEISKRTKERINEKKKQLPLSEITAMAGNLPVGDFEFEKALRSSDMAFICEIKKASPSKGIIAEDFPYIDIAKEYEAAGAAAISVLTEPYYFKGDDEYLREISKIIKTPLLRKDFTIDEYMIYEAKTIGAAAILLICSILDEDTIAKYIEIAKSLGLSSLVETHDEFEIDMALRAGADIIGVNNRNLKTFEVDITLSERLRSLVPPDKIFIAESGIKTCGDIKRLKAAGVNGVLIGETIMRSKDKKQEILKLKGGNVT